MSSASKLNIAQATSTDTVRFTIEALLDIVERAPTIDATDVQGMPSL